MESNPSQQQQAGAGQTTGFAGTRLWIFVMAESKENGV
jgi:hypothetical protein